MAFGAKTFAAWSFRGVWYWGGIPVPQPRWPDLSVLAIVPDAIRMAAERERTELQVVREDEFYV